MNFTTVIQKINQGVYRKPGCRRSRPQRREILVFGVFFVSSERSRRIEQVENPDCNVGAKRKEKLLVVGKVRMLITNKAVKTKERTVVVTQLFPFLKTNMRKIN